MKYSVELYYLSHGRQRSPYIEWLRSLRDTKGKVSIIRRIARMEAGNFGDRKFCRDGVYELRIEAGPGYRVYYAFSNWNTILILRGGNKSTQQSDIDLAISYLRDWQRRGTHEK